MPDVETFFKQPKAAKKPGKPVRSVRAGNVAAYRRKATRLWGAVVHARDAGCQKCGRTEGRLEAHHVLPREFNATRTDETNGVLLCFRCHKGRDGVHGDPFGAVVFYTERYGTEGYRQLRLKAFNGVNQRFPLSFWRAECARLEELLERYGA